MREEHLGELISLLPPAPEGWVVAAKELPRVERGLEQILALAEADTQFHTALLADAEAALREAGFQLDEHLVGGVRERLDRDQVEGGD